MTPYLHVPESLVKLIDSPKVLPPVDFEKITSAAVIQDETNREYIKGYNGSRNSSCVITQHSTWGGS